jgi:hypothetical protein
MAVGQDDCLRPRAKQPRRGGTDGAGRAAQSRIDEHPARGGTDEEHVDECDAAPVHIGHD